LLQQFVKAMVTVMKMIIEGDDNKGASTPHQLEVESSRVVKM